MQNILGSPTKKWKAPYTQQGDVLIKKCGEFGVFETEFKEIPKKAKKKTGNLVFKGQTNSHALYKGKFQLFENDGILFLKVTKATVLDHVKDHKTKTSAKAEHHAQWIPVGEYFIDGVLEYNHLTEEAKRVID